MSKAKFIDEAKIYVEAGRGGNGCVSFRREKYVPRGGPDGGDGGRGGSVILEGSASMRTLLDYHFKRYYKASHGEHGQGKEKNGKSGEDIVLPVPIGTVVRDENGELLGEILKEKQRLTVALGGTGGRGNLHFVTSTRQAPGFAEQGEPGEKKQIFLELRLLADVGLVGFPNAGKSTLISSVSKAKPKIADYPFTTLTPHLGAVYLPDGRSFVMCDLPGLIKGSSEGKGLGVKFLRHISRTAVLLFVLDMSSLDSAKDQIRILQDEIRKYDAELLKRPFIVAGTKIDIPEARERAERLKGSFFTANIKFFPVSAVTKEGISELLYALIEEVEKFPREVVASETKVIVPEGEPEIKIHQIKKGLFEVKGKEVDKAVAMTDMENEEALLYLQRKLKRFDLEKRLLKAGAKRNDTIVIAGVEFDFEPDETLESSNE